MIRQVEALGYRVDSAYGSIYALHDGAYHWFAPLDLDSVQEILGAI